MAEWVDWLIRASEEETQAPHAELQRLQARMDELGIRIDELVMYEESGEAGIVGRTRNVADSRGVLAAIFGSLDDEESVRLEREREKKRSQAAADHAARKDAEDRERTRRIEEGMSDWKPSVRPSEQEATSES